MSYLSKKKKILLLSWGYTWNEHKLSYFVVNSPYPFHSYMQVRRRLLRVMLEFYMWHLSNVVLYMLRFFFRIFPLYHRMTESFWRYEVVYIFFFSILVIWPFVDHWVLVYTNYKVMLYRYWLYQMQYTLLIIYSKGFYLSICISSYKSPNFILHKKFYIRLGLQLGWVKSGWWLT